MTERGLVCQRCVLREQSADIRQMHELGRDRSGPRSATGILISAAVWTSKEASRSDQWVGDDLLFIPRFGSGLDVVQLTDDELVIGEIGRDRSSAEELGALWNLAEWPRLAERVSRIPWKNIESIRIGASSFEIRAAKNTHRVHTNDADRLRAALELRLPGCEVASEPETARSILAGNGCLLVLAGVVAGLIYAGTSFLGSLDWSNVPDDASLGELAFGGLLWLLGAYGPTVTLVVFGLLALVVAAVTLSQLRTPPLIHTLRPGTAREGAPPNAVPRDFGWAKLHMRGANMFALGYYYRDAQAGASFRTVVELADAPDERTIEERARVAGYTSNRTVRLGAHETVYVEGLPEEIAARNRAKLEEGGLTGVVVLRLSAAEQAALSLPERPDWLGAYLR